MTCLPTLVFSIIASAQAPTGALMSGMAANSKQLKQYTFKQRTEMLHKGELKNAKVVEIHYSADGERLVIPLDTQKAQAEAPLRGPGHRIIARKIEGEKEKMKDYVERLMSLTGRYLNPAPDKLQAALATAEVTTGGGSNQVRIGLRNFVNAGDSMTMSFDQATMTRNYPPHPGK